MDAPPYEPPERKPADCTDAKLRGYKGVRRSKCQCFTHYMIWYRHNFPKAWDAMFRPGYW